MLTKTPGAMLKKDDIEQYRELGYLVVPDVFDAELLAEQLCVGKDLDHDVNQRANCAPEEDDEQPVRVRPASNEMHDGNRLQDCAVAKEVPHGGNIVAGR